MRRKRLFVSISGVRQTRPSEQVPWARRRGNGWRLAVAHKQVKRIRVSFPARRAQRDEGRESSPRPTFNGFPSPRGHHRRRCVVGEGAVMAARPGMTAFIPERILRWRAKGSAILRSCWRRLEDPYIRRFNKAVEQPPTCARRNCCWRRIERHPITYCGIHRPLATASVRGGAGT
jgi:hypothetical protein